MKKIISFLKEHYNLVLIILGCIIVLFALYTFNEYVTFGLIVLFGTPFVFLYGCLPDTWCDWIDHFWHSVHPDICGLIGFVILILISACLYFIWYIVKKVQYRVCLLLVMVCMYVYTINKNFEFYYEAYNDITNYISKTYSKYYTPLALLTKNGGYSYKNMVIEYNSTGERPYVTLRKEYSLSKDTNVWVSLHLFKKDDDYLIPSKADTTYWANHDIIEQRHMCKKDIKSLLDEVLSPQAIAGKKTADSIALITANIADSIAHITANETAERKAKKGAAWAERNKYFAQWESILEEQKKYEYGTLKWTELESKQASVWAQYEKAEAYHDSLPR